MRMVSKKLLTLGLTAIMAVSSLTTAFAGQSPSEPKLTIYGQKPVKVGDLDNDNGVVYGRIYQVIIVGKNTLATSDITVDNGWFGGWSSIDSFTLEDYTTNQGDRYDIYPGTNKDDVDWDTFQGYWIQYLPDGVSVDSLGEDAKYVIYANDSTQTAQPTEKTASWASNDKGWWIQNSDGTYLTNDWYQSPASGLWYYMGADGYMLTNTTTPDGYTVNADGVWVQ